MPNDLVTQGRRDVAVAGNPWADAARDVETGTYLKFNGNDGRWSFGQDDEDLPDGSRAVADMETMAFGWTCWVDSNVEEEVYVSVLDGRPPAEHTLTDYGPYTDDDGWRESAKLSLVLESYDGDDQDEAVGTPLLWKSSTGGQVRQIKKLSGQYGRLFAQHPGEFPIVELGSEGYAPKNKKHGKKKYSPTLKIVGWMTAEELAALTGDAGLGDDDYEEPEARPARAGRAAPEPEPEEEQEEAPARGRGRRAAAPADDGDGVEQEDEAPARGRGRRAAAAEPEEEQEEAPVRGRGRRAAAAEPEEEQEEERPARGRRAAAPADDADDDEGAAPARGRGRRAAAEPADDEGDEASAPEPRGRSAARGGNRRLRNFD